MALASAVQSRNLKRIAAGRLLLKAGRSFVRGRPRTGFALLGAAWVASKSLALGVLAEGALWFYRRQSQEAAQPFRRRARLGRG